MRKDPRFPKLHIVDHPLVQHKLTLMREKETSTRDFRELLKEIAMLMGYELTRDYPLTTRRIETPLAEFDAPVMEGKKPVIVPVLRAGLGMTDGLLTLMPGARVGHIGLYRDENKRPVEYFVRLPDTEGRNFIVVDRCSPRGIPAPTPSTPSRSAAFPARRSSSWRSSPRPKA